MADLWERVHALCGRTLATPTGLGSYSVVDVDDRGLKLKVRGGGIYYISRPALEAAADLADRDLSAARIRALGIFESQPSYVAGIVHAMRHNELAPAAPRRDDDAIPSGKSKYDTFWTSQLGAMRMLLDRAARGEVVDLAATAITGFGNRTSWSGSADVKQGAVVSAAMAHMLAFGRLVAASGMCVAFPETTFHFTMSSTGRLRISARADNTRTRGQREWGSSRAIDPRARAQALPPSVSPAAFVGELANLRLPRAGACATVHRMLSELPVYQSPADVQFHDGLYVFYEKRERSPHVDGVRIVRIGNHPRTQGRLVARLREHYATRRDAKNGSVFRLLTGGALIRRDDPDSSCLLPGPGLGHWEKHMLHECDRCAPYEQRVTEFLRSECMFRCIRIADRVERNRFEALLIATVAQCTECCPSESWLGLCACSREVKRSGLWNSDLIEGPILTDRDLGRLQQLVAETPGARPSSTTDLSSTLLLIPCSAGKDGWTDPGLPVKSVRDLVEPELAALLDQGRQLAFERTSIDLKSPLRPAIATYSGYPYAAPGFRDLLVSHLSRGLHCLIISGGYGLIRPEEPIHKYQAHLQQTRGIWSNRIPVLLRDYVERNGIRRTFGVFSAIYSGVVPANLTGQDSRTVEAFDIERDQGAALHAVPRKVGSTLMHLMQSDYETS